MTRASRVSHSQPVTDIEAKTRRAVSPGDCALPRSAVVFSCAASACAAVASVATLAWAGAFPPPIERQLFNTPLAEARGWSVVTLTLVLPALLVGLTMAVHGSSRGRRVWLGTLIYLVYTYLEMATSPPFTPLYLLYIGAFAAASIAALIGLCSTDVRAVTDATHLPRRTTAVFALVVGIGLALAWLRDIFTRMRAGAFGWPEGTSAVGHVVHALDLGFQVPLCLAAAVTLFFRSRSGSFVAALMLVNGVCMAAALTAMVVASSLLCGQTLLQAAPFAVLTVAFTATAVRFFRAL